ncbi:MAG: SPOR domain-containing protein, partial [Gammaproteobacteria bacterium]|nr:SPOR domain-containing protein [Gammaproteobacteria bacterium]
RGDAGAAGALLPQVAIGARPDAGDADRGLGREVGGGVAWTHPGLGLGLRLRGRRLVAHEAAGAGSSGLSVQFAFDPRPDSALGPSLALRRDLGSPASGVQALLARGAAGAPGARVAEPAALTAEASWGLPAFGARYVGSPRLTWGAGPRMRELGVGLRLAPAPAAGAAEGSLDIGAVRRDLARGPAEHAVRLAFRRPLGGDRPAAGKRRPDAGGLPLAGEGPAAPARRAPAGAGARPRGAVAAPPPPARRPRGAAAARAAALAPALPGTGAVPSPAQGLLVACGRTLHLQIGAFAVRGNAERLARRMRSLTELPVRVAPPDSRTPLHRVRLGPLPLGATGPAGEQASRPGARITMH